MSGVISGVKKVFKKVTKSPIGKIAVAAGIAYLTAGLGGSLLEGLGVAGTSASGALTIAGSETLGTVLSSALSGSLAGGITSGLTGEGVGKGLAFGAVGGAISGGLRLALGDPIQGAASSGSTGATQGGANPPASVPGSNPASQTSSAVQQTGVTQPGAIAAAPDALPPDYSVGYDPTAAGPAVASAAGQPAAQSGGGLLSKIGAFAEKNQALTIAAGGALASGLGQGLLAKATADATEKASREKIEADRQRQADIAASHTGINLNNTPQLNTTPRPSPTERFDPSTYGGQYVYDPGVGRIVFVRNQNQTQVA